MKYPSSSRPIASKTSRRIIRLAPATQSVGPASSETGGADDVAVEEPRDRAEPEPPLQLREDRGEPEGRLQGGGVGELRAGSRPGRPRDDRPGSRPGRGAPGPDERVGVEQPDQVRRRRAEASAGAIATLLPAANPPFRGATTSDAQPPQPFSRIAEARRSAESSPEAFSTTTTRAPGSPATSGSSVRRQSIASPADR